MISLLLLLITASLSAAQQSAQDLIHCRRGYTLRYVRVTFSFPYKMERLCVPMGFKPTRPLNTVAPPLPLTWGVDPHQSAGFCPAGKRLSYKLVKVLGKSLSVPACVDISAHGFVPPKQKSAGFCPPGKKWGTKFVNIAGISYAYPGCVDISAGGFVPPKQQGSAASGGPVGKMKEKYDSLKAKLENKKQRLLAKIKKLIEKKKQLMANTDTSVPTGSQGFSGILAQVMSKLDGETQKLLAECKTLDEALAKLEELKAGAFVPPNQQSAGFCPPGKKWGLKNTIILGRVVPLPGCV